MQVSPERLDIVAERLERRTVIVGAAVAVVIGIAVMFVNLWIGLAVAIVAPVVWYLYVRTMVDAAPARLIATLGAREASPDEFPRLQNLLEGLGVSTGVADVEVKVIDTEAMNAAIVVGRHDTEIIVTSALAHGLSRLELEAVLANLLARARDGSARYCTVVLGLPGRSGAGERMQSQLGEHHPVRTDVAAVSVTRYPPGLRSALETMASVGTRIGSAPSASAPLWLVPPEDDPSSAPISLRVAVLDEL